MQRPFKLSLKAQKSLLGMLFTLPFILGFGAFLAYPFFQSIVFSLSKLTIVSTGYVLDFVGLENYRHALFVDPRFRQVFLETTVTMLTQIPVILIFSFFAANLLNQRFPGRTLARVIFFLPVVMGAEITLKMQQADYMQQAMSLSESGLIPLSILQSFLVNLKLPLGFVNFIFEAVNAVPVIIRSSGIQILIFLAALQSIPKSLYEAAHMEGATSWEAFWKITFPLISPLLLVNVVYTIVDSFTAPDNVLLDLIQDTAWSGAGFGVSTAMSWIYFIMIIVLLVLTMLFVSKGVHYET
jgi:ABC-type sugar transport system permease subunit